MTATGNELVTLNQLKTLKDSLGGGLSLDENDRLVNGSEKVSLFRVLNVNDLTDGEVEEPPELDAAGVQLGGLAYYYDNE